MLEPVLHDQEMFYMLLSSCCSQLDLHSIANYCLLAPHLENDQLTPIRAVIRLQGMFTLIIVY